MLSNHTVQVFDCGKSGQNLISSQGMSKHTRSNEWVTIAKYIDLGLNVLDPNEC